MIKWCLQLKVFFLDNWLLRNLKQTFISLIPKKPEACNFNQLHPIGLCNVCYKVISKILVNRIRPLLNKIMDHAQVAFLTEALLKCGDCLGDCS